MKTNKFSASIFNFVFNSINQLIMIVNGIVMVPIYFKYMSISTYGAWLATGNVIAMLGILESGFSFVITQKMSVTLEDKDEIKFLELAGANIFTSIFLAATVFLLGILISPFIADWVNVEAAIREPITKAYIISLVSASISIAVSLNGAFPQVWQDTKAVGKIKTAANIIGIISLIIFLLSGFGVVSLALGYLTKALFDLIFQGRWIILKWKKLQLSQPIFNLKVIKNLVRDSFYPFLSRLSSVLMGSSQSFIIAFFISPTLAAVYEITSKIGIVLTNFISTISGSFFALFSLTFSTNDKIKINKLVKEVTILFTTLLFAALLFSLIFTKTFVYYWVGLDKFGGNNLLFLILAALFISHVKKYLNNLLFTGGLINKSSKLDIMSMILYVIVLFIIIEKTQIYAVPLATLSSGIIFLGMYTRMLHKELFIDLQFIFKLILKLLLISAVFVLFHNMLSFDLKNITTLIFYITSFTIIYITTIVLTNKKFVEILIQKLKIGNKK